MAATQGVFAVTIATFNCTTEELKFEVGWQHIMTFNCTTEELKWEKALKVACF